MKGFLRKVLLIASFGAALTFYGCNKDYGQDIEDVRKDLTAALEEQKSTLTAAINAALEDAKKYAAEADQAIKESAEAYADAAAKQAASEVKAELLTEIQNQVADALADAKKYTDDEISDLKTELSGRIDAIDSDINTIKSTLTEYETRIAALETFKAQAENRIAILEDFMSKIEGLNLEDEIAKLNQVIADLQTLRNEFNKAVEDLGLLTGRVDDIEDRLDDIDSLLATYGSRLDSIDDAIEDINANLLAIEDMIANRLTSISLIPEAYYEGIPAMVFNYIGYQALIPQVGDETEDLYTTASDQIFMIPTVNANQFRYNVSPSTWTVDCIGSQDYVLEDAEIIPATRGYMDNGYLTVASIEKNNRGELVANVRAKNALAILPFAEQGNSIITAALQLGIADKYLTDAEKEAKLPVNVTSEYSVLAGKAGSIHIAPESLACLPVDHKSFFLTWAEAKDGVATYKEVYNTSIDLMDSVRVCINENGKLISLNADDLAGDYSYLGLKFRFAIPSAKFEIGSNKTNQQEFIKFVEGSESAFQSVIPGGATNNEAAIGKTPIVRVELLASNGDVVDVQWIKIEWVREKVQDYNLGEIFTSEYTLSCKDYADQIEWSEFVELILGKIGENGMSYADFYTYYGSTDLHRFYLLDYNFWDLYKSSIYYDDPAQVDPKASVITWEVPSNGFAGVIYDILKSEDKVASYRVKYELNPIDAERHGKITFILTIKVTLPEDMPSFHGQNLSMNWTAENLAAIHPVGYSKGTAAGATKVYYEFPMNDLFTVNKDGLFVDNIYECRAWDMQFGAESTIDNFKVHFAWNKMNALFAGDENGTGYIFSKNNGSFAARLVYGGLTVNGPFTNWYTLAEGPQTIGFALADVDKFNQGDAAAAKELLNDVNVSDELRKVIPVNIWSRLSENNEYLVKSFNVWVVSPVSVPDPKFTKEITDVNKDKIEVSLPISFSASDIKDFQNKALKNADELSYYGVYGPVWNIAQAASAASSIYTNVVSVDNNWDVDENVDPKNSEDLKRMKTLADLGIEVTYDSASGKLVFTNISTHLVKDIKLYFKGTYGHKFADYETWGTINFKKNDGK